MCQQCSSLMPLVAVLAFVEAVVGAEAFEQCQHLVKIVFVGMQSAYVPPWLHLPSLFVALLLFPPPLLVLRNWYSNIRLLNVLFYSSWRVALPCFCYYAHLRHQESTATELRWYDLRCPLQTRTRSKVGELCSVTFVYSPALATAGSWSRCCGGCASGCRRGGLNGLQLPLTMREIAKYAFRAKASLQKKSAKLCFENSN